MLEKRLEILLEPEEFDRLKILAEARRRSMGELVREALREKYLAPSGMEREAAVRRLLSDDLHVKWPEWNQMEQDIAREVDRDLLVD